MENIIAILENDTITEIVIASDDWAASSGLTTVNVTNELISGSRPTKGWKYINGEFIHADDLQTPEERLALKIEEERYWRDAELVKSDKIVPLTDHPHHAAYMTYRQELRDYPSQPDFPYGTRPVSPE
jgi:hypothetical protein